MIRRAGQLVLLVLLVSGCGREATVPDRLDGGSVARMAERQLEAENPRLAPGTLACPDLDFRVGAAVRCARTSELSGGRVVEVDGTVRVTSRSSGGHLHVTMDDQAREFGVAGEQLVADVRAQYRRRFRLEPSRLRCPYLPGRVGARVTCRLEAGGATHEIGVVVTGVDPTTYRTTYTVGVDRPGSG